MKNKCSEYLKEIGFILVGDFYTWGNVKIHINNPIRRKEINLLIGDNFKVIKEGNIEVWKGTPSKQYFIKNTIYNINNNFEFKTLYIGSDIYWDHKISGKFSDIFEPIKTVVIGEFTNITENAEVEGS